jgi:GDP-L-fucose synthase
MGEGPLYVAGHKGLVGSAVWRAGEARGLNLLGRTRAELDLRVGADVDAFI